MLYLFTCLNNSTKANYKTNTIKDGMKARTHREIHNNTLTPWSGAPDSRSPRQEIPDIL
jgi:hypothetical protein